MPGASPEHPATRVSGEGQEPKGGWHPSSPAPRLMARDPKGGTRPRAWLWHCWPHPAPLHSEAAGGKDLQLSLCCLDDCGPQILLGAGHWGVSSEKARSPASDRGQTPAHRDAADPGAFYKSPGQESSPQGSLSFNKRRVSWTRSCRARARNMQRPCGSLWKGLVKECKLEGERTEGGAGRPQRNSHCARSSRKSRALYTGRDTELGY